MTIRQKLKNSDGVYEAVARRKQHNRRSDYVPTAEFHEYQQKKSWKTQASELGLSRELNASGSTMKLALN